MPSAAPNFVLITDVGNTGRQDFPMFDPTLLDPLVANPLYDGEWLERDANYKGIRAGGAVLSWPVFSERGRYDTQALRKATVLFLGQYEADTKIFDATGLALGDPLMVDNVTIDGQTKSGLKKHAGGDLIVGRVTRLPGANGGKLRFFRLY